MKKALVPDISRHLHAKQGFCHPDWEAITDCIEANVVESDWNEAWVEAASQWVGHLCDKLGGDYRIYETTNFLFLSDAPDRVIKDACSFYETALKEILENLEGVASDEGLGKHVVLMFNNIDDYYAYILYFYPEGDQPMSGGVCLNGEGYVHYAFPATDYYHYRTVLVHELTHGCLGHLSIPAWLNEAMAMRMEEVICGTEIFELDKEILERHIKHWDSNSIQEFWRGDSWEIHGESFELSYKLAQILWRKIEVVLKTPTDVLLSFVATADFNDGGQAACESVLGFCLGELVCDFLGEGDWDPKPVQWVAKSDSTASLTR